MHFLIFLFAAFVTADSSTDDDVDGINEVSDSTELHPLAPLWLDLIRRGAKDHMFYLGRELGCKQQGNFLCVNLIVLFVLYMWQDCGSELTVADLVT